MSHKNAHFVRAFNFAEDLKPKIQIVYGYIVKIAQPKNFRESTTTIFRVDLQNF